MDVKEHKPSLKRMGTSVTRKHLSVSQEDLVRTECLREGQPLPLVIQPAVEGVSLLDWTRRNLGFIETKLLDHGGILFRNFNVQMAAEKFGWDARRKTAGVGYGLACGVEKGGYTAACAEVRVDRASGREPLRPQKNPRQGELRQRLKRGGAPTCFRHHLFGRSQSTIGFAAVYRCFR